MSLLKIDNLSRLNELLPEAVARERDVLIVANVDNQLTVTHPKNDFGEEDRKTVEYVLGRPVRWVTNQRNEIRTAFRMAYGTVRNIDGCDWEFATQCPERWNNLKETDQDAVRHCSTCNKLVHLCLTEAEVIDHAAHGDCVCFVSEDMHCESVGDVILQQFDDTPIDFSDDIETPNTDNENHTG